MDTIQLNNAKINNAKSVPSLPVMQAWQASRGLDGRHPWNMHARAFIRGKLQTQCDVPVQLFFKFIDIYN
jgi:hypothetical protein